MSRWYKLDGHTPVPCEMMEGVIALENSESRQVHFTKLADYEVSTVFLGFDHAHFGGPPLLFETMIFGGNHDDFQRRYSTWDEAAVGHANAVRLASGEIDEMPE